MVLKAFAVPDYSLYGLDFCGTLCIEVERLIQGCLIDQSRMRLRPKMPVRWHTNLLTLQGTEGKPPQYDSRWDILFKFGMRVAYVDGSQSSCIKCTEITKGSVIIYICIERFICLRRS